MSEQTEHVSFIIDDIDEWAEHIKGIKSKIRPADKVEYLSVSGSWCSLAFFNGEFTYPVKYRIKPRTIRIGEYDVPEPMREAPVVDSIYYLPVLDGSDNRAVVWGDDEYDRKWLQLGLCHKTGEASALHAKALISLTAKKG